VSATRGPSGANDRLARAKAAVGSVLFLILAPGVIAGVLPWWLTGWEVREPARYWLPVQVAGVILLGTGVVVLLHRSRASSSRALVRLLRSLRPSVWSWVAFIGTSAIRCTWRSRP
jgi:hypothetical protein